MFGGQREVARLLGVDRSRVSRWVAGDEPDQRNRAKLDWTNVTLFHQRVLPHVDVADTPRALSTRLAEVREAAGRLGVAL